MMQSSVRSFAYSTMTDARLLAVRQTYVDGNCHFLARCLARKTGWPLATLLDRDGEHAYHAFVISPNGPLDIDGPHDADELRKDWGGSVIDGQAYRVLDVDTSDEVFDRWGTAEDGEVDSEDEIDYFAIWDDAESTATLVLSCYQK
jgi:hypothetical protein